MKVPEKGQIAILSAVCLTSLLFLLAVLIDGGHLLVERHNLTRAADAAAKAGLIVVGDFMVTQVVEAKTTAAALTSPQAPLPQTSSPSRTPSPMPDGFQDWLTDDHRTTLVAPAMQTLVAEGVLDAARANRCGLEDPGILTVEVRYPDRYDPEAPDLELLVRIEKRIVLVFGQLFQIDQGVIYGTSRQSVPQH